MFGGERFRQKTRCENRRTLCVLPVFATKLCGKTVLAGQAEIFRGDLPFLLVEEALQKGLLLLVVFVPGSVAELS